MHGSSSKSSPHKHLKTVQDVITARQATFPHRRPRSRSRSRSRSQSRPASDDGSIGSEEETPMPVHWKSRSMVGKQRKDCTQLFLDLPGESRFGTHDDSKGLARQSWSSSSNNMGSRTSDNKASPTIPSIADIIRSHTPSPSPSPKTPIMSINDIIGLHLPTAKKAQEDAIVRAQNEIKRASLFLTNSPQDLPSLPKKREKSKRLSLIGKPLPIIPIRTTSTPEQIATLSPRIPPRSTSRSESPPEKRSINPIAEVDVTEDFVVGQALLDRLENSHAPSTPTSAASSAGGRNRQSLVAQGRLSHSPGDLARTNSTSSSSNSRDRASTPIGSTSPASELSDSQAMALYLRSPRLTKLVTLTNLSHRSTPLTVSLADVGSPTGKPVVIFLGLGCVRYLIALYDELATVFGLRLICIDRWGLGKTDEIAQEKRNLLDWAEVVGCVMDHLGIGTFQVLAHSAGTPYALATALKLDTRIVGKIHLLAPWVSADIDGGESIHINRRKGR